MCVCMCVCACESVCACVPLYACVSVWKLSLPTTQVSRLCPTISTYPYLNCLHHLTYTQLPLSPFTLCTPLCLLLLCFALLLLLVDCAKETISDALVIHYPRLRKSLRVCWNKQAATLLPRLPPAQPPPSPSYRSPKVARPRQQSDDFANPPGRACAVGKEREAGTKREEWADAGWRVEERGEREWQREESDRRKRAAHTACAAGACAGAWAKPNGESQHWLTSTSLSLSLPVLLLLPVWLPAAAAAAQFAAWRGRVSADGGVNRRCTRQLKEKRKNN